VKLERTYASSNSVRARLLVLMGIVVLTAMLITACSGGKKTGTSDSDVDDENAAADANVKKGVKPEPDPQVAVLDTGFGRIVIELYPNIAPEMVKRYKQLIQEGFYNGTTFHRINPELGIIQGGDPLSKDADPRNDGTGNSPYPNVPAEFSDIPYDRGIVGAARQGGGMGMSEDQAKNTANCQFFITLKRVPDFDKRYTVFGRVIQGLGDVADIIAGAPTEAGNERPADNIVIKSATLQPRSDFANAATPAK
jgi:cyclophilin family peptidyl-prolyl cis-trans isomerase